MPLSTITTMPQYNAFLEDLLAPHNELLLSESSSCNREFQKVQRGTICLHMGDLRGKFIQMLDQTEDGQAICTASETFGRLIIKVNQVRNQGFSCLSASEEHYRFRCVMDLINRLEDCDLKDQQISEEIARDLLIQKIALFALQPHQRIKVAERLLQVEPRVIMTHILKLDLDLVTRTQVAFELANQGIEFVSSLYHFHLHPDDGFQLFMRWLPKRWREVIIYHPCMEFDIGRREKLAIEICKSNPLRMTWLQQFNLTPASRHNVAKEILPVCPGAVIAHISDLQLSCDHRFDLAKRLLAIEPKIVLRHLAEFELSQQQCSHLALTWTVMQSQLGCRPQSSKSEFQELAIFTGNGEELT